MLPAPVHRRAIGHLYGLRACLTMLLALASPAVFGQSAPAHHAATTPPAAAFVNQFQANEGVFPGYRRNHAKGVCIAGYFQSNGQAAQYSVARVLAPGMRTPVYGRLSIPGTSPYAWDDSTPIRGMALVFEQPGKQQWRTAMNAVPAFPVATPQADLAFMRDQQPDPATGDPDPKKLAAFFAHHPHANAFRIWDQTTPPSASYATQRYNSLDSFYLVDADGHTRAVRWSMVPEAKPDGQKVDHDAPDFLARDLRQRLEHAPLKWHLVFIFAAPGDAIDNASIAWPANRKHMVAGTLTITASHPQQTGRCRNTNFDPWVLPPGIEPSADPLLQLRHAAYAVSHRRQVQERTHAATPARHSTPVPQASH